jgi:hypothetical protein
MRQGCDGSGSALRRTMRVAHPADISRAVPSPCEIALPNRAPTSPQLLGAGRGEAAYRFPSMRLKWSATSLIPASSSSPLRKAKFAVTFRFSNTMTVTSASSESL